MVNPWRTRLASKPSLHSATSPILSRYFGCIDHSLVENPSSNPLFKLVFHKQLNPFHHHGVLKNAA
ncbi:hypothetical protein IMZ38_00640 [Thermosphaera chiliense]|uniref:Uncharacterized protein n=1 Tax=Thermosphaera chiliense TaxID=3402707 RepID=A0A7M1UU76_9CREN|nr:hypothetical protein [Thermosphaera aggregans]QOR94494.1 hypothetical protein IMZ38_00640 [Thermosphaera aggregans]